MVSRVVGEGELSRKSTLQVRTGTDGLHGTPHAVPLLSIKCHGGTSNRKAWKGQGYFTEDPNAMVEFGVDPTGNVKLLKGFD